MNSEEKIDFGRLRDTSFLPTSRLNLTPESSRALYNSFIRLLEPRLESNARAFGFEKTWYTFADGERVEMTDNRLQNSYFHDRPDDPRTLGVSIQLSFFHPSARLSQWHGYVGNVYAGR